MKMIGYGKRYKCNPRYHAGKVGQKFLPVSLPARGSLGNKDQGDMVDSNLESEGASRE